MSNNNREVINARREEKSRLMSLVVLTWYRLVLSGAIVLQIVRKCRFQYGNKKLAASDDIAFLVWSLPAVLTCPGATVMCMMNCYARRDERFPSVRASRIINYMISQQDDFEYVLYKALRNQIYTNKGAIRKRFKNKEIVVRVHESGDFYRDRYMIAWFKVAAMFPDVTFFAYTKSFAMYERCMKYKPDNFEMRASVWADTTPEEFGIIARCGMSIYTAYDADGVRDAVNNGATRCTCESCTKCGCACARHENKEIVTEIH